MNHQQAISRLTDCAASVRARGATALYLFGSIARDEARPDSDLDLFVDYDPAQNFSLIDLAAIKNLLQQHLAIEVDVTTRDSLHPLLRDEIERTAIRVF
jgi:predicted nucleotidyltransferase